VAYFRGEPLVLAATKSIGVLEGGRHYTVHVPLTNASRRPIKIIGAQASCICTTLTGLPLSLAPGESRSLDIDISTIERMGRIETRIDLFTDHPASQRVSFRIVGMVIPPVDSKLSSH
jgi:hypothetical protein